MSKITAPEPLAAFRAALLRIASIPDDELAYVAGHVARREYAARTLLLAPGEAVTRGWYLASGFLRFYYVSEKGREFNKAFARPGEIVVPLAGALTATPSQYAIEAVTDATAVVFPTSLMSGLYARHPIWERVGRVLVEQMALRKEAREHELLMDSAIVRYLRFEKRYPELVGILPQRQIASYVGITEQALSRLLRKKAGSP